MSTAPASPTVPAGASAAREGRAPGGASPAAVPPAGAALSVALSDVSHVSVDSHHSQRSRWSTAATVATTVNPRGMHEPAMDPEPLPEELSGAGSSGGSTDSCEAPPCAAVSLAPAPAAAHHSEQQAINADGCSGSGRVTAPGTALAERHGSRSAWNGRAGASPPSSSAPTRGVPHPAAAEGCDAIAAAASGSTRHVAAAVAGSTRLPPRLIVFHPDGSTFGIGVDKLRERELLDAAEAAATQRRRQQRHAAAAAAAAAAVARGAGTASPGVDADAEEGLDTTYPGWRPIFQRQKYVLIALLAVDIAYLTVLLALRLAWGNSSTEPNLSGAAQFFVGSHPESTSISYLAGSMFTDCVALYGTLQNFASVVTLFIVWSVVLGAFSILEMPLLFTLWRFLLLVAAFQLRFSMARLRNMLPPTSFGIMASATGQRVSAAGGTAWAAVTRPFRRRGSQAEAGVGLPSVVALPQRSSAQLEQQRSMSGGAAQPGSPTGVASAQLATARSSALFRAALLRMMSDQQRQAQQAQQQGQGQGQDVEAGLPPGSTGEAPGQAVGGGGAAAAARQPPERRPSGIAGAAGGAAAEPGGVDRLYARIMEDLAAVAAAPSSSSARRRQRRREREWRLTTAAVTGAAPGGSGEGGDAGLPRSSAAAAADGTATADGNGSSEGEGEGAHVARPAGSSSSRRRRSSGSGSHAAQSEAAFAQAAATLRGSTAPGGAPPEVPTLQELVALLTFHSQQQQLRRQQRRHVDIVPLVTLDAPHPPGVDEAPEGGAGAGAGASGSHALS